MGIITIGKLLEIHGLDLSKKIKLVRHKDAREKVVINGTEIEGDPLEWYRTNKEAFLNYQSEQQPATFNNVEYIVSFVGEDGTKARFIGVFKLLGRDFEKENRLNNGEHCYNMEEVPGFEELSERVIIDWGKGTLAWHQWLKNNDKEVIEIVPGFDYLFPGYANVTLSLAQMRDIIIDNAYPVWKKMLSAVNCIYVIADSNTNSLYVGSTYNREGIWGRWKEYAETNGHGGDVELKKLIKQDSNYALKNFKWSILETLPINISDKEAIKRETRYKEMLRAACLLNRN